MVLNSDGRFPESEKTRDEALGNAAVSSVFLAKADATRLFNVNAKEQCEGGERRSTQDGQLRE